MATSWERLTSVTLSSTDDEIVTPTFTPKKHLRVSYNGVSQSADSDVWLQFGTGGTMDTTNGNYQWRNGRNSNSDNTDSNDSKINLIGANMNTTNGYTYSDIYISNESASNKLCIAETLTVTAGAGTAPDNAETVGRYANTSAQINILRVFLTQNSAVYAVGSTITVWGADDQPSTPFYPNLPNGEIFEESDTGKHYMFDGTSAWNEMT